jgi:hypothetical protein
MFARFLTRLAVLWLIVWGVLILWAFSLHGTTLERGAGIAMPLVLGGPPLLLLGLAWLFAPRRK